MKKLRKRWGALCVATLTALAMIGCNLSVDNEDERAAYAEQNNSNSGGSSGSETSTTSLYVGLGGENTFNLTSVTLDDTAQAISHTTLAPSAWNAIDEFEIVQVPKGSTVSYTFTQESQATVDTTAWLTWSLAIYDDATVSSAKGNFIRGDNWLNLSSDAGFSAGLWSDGGVTAAGTYSNDYTYLTAGSQLASTDVVVVSVAYKGTQVVVTETVNGTVAYTMSATVSEEEEEASLSSISITGQTTAFEVGSEFSLGNAVITATYSDGSTKTLSASDVTITGGDTSSTGSKTVTVSYTDGDVKKTCEYTITITNPISNIALAEGSTLYSYSADESTYYIFGKAAANVIVTYSDSSTEPVSASNATFSDVTASSATMTYAGKSASVSLTNKTSLSDLISVASVDELVENCTDYTVGTADCTTSWSAGSQQTLAKDASQTVYFVNYGSGAANWNNFLIELWNSDSAVCGVTLRADNYGWNYGESTSREFDYASVVTTGTSLPSDWATWLTAMNGAIIKLDISYSNGTITFKATSDDVEDWAQVYSFENCTSDELYWHLNCDGSYMVVLK